MKVRVEGSCTCEHADEKGTNRTYCCCVLLALRLLMPPSGLASGNCYVALRGFRRGNQTSHCSFTEMHLLNAAKEGNARKVKKLLMAGVPCDWQAPDERTPLIVAA